MRPRIWRSWIIIHLSEASLLLSSLLKCYIRVRCDGIVSLYVCHSSLYVISIKILVLQNWQLVLLLLLELLVSVSNIRPLIHLIIKYINTLARVQIVPILVWIDPTLRIKIIHVLNIQWNPSSNCLHILIDDIITFHYK